MHDQVAEPEVDILHHEVVSDCRAVPARDKQIAREADQAESREDVKWSQIFREVFYLVCHVLSVLSFDEFCRGALHEIRLIRDVDQWLV